MTTTPYQGVYEIDKIARDLVERSKDRNPNETYAEIEAMVNHFQKVVYKGLHSPRTSGFNVLAIGADARLSIALRGGQHK